jgi:DHA2 family multidrug resistance protein-like MFS transporter
MKPGLLQAAPEVDAIAPHPLSGIHISLLRAIDNSQEHHCPNQRKRMNEETVDIGEKSSSDTRHARAGRKEWIGLAVIALPCMLYSMDLTVLNLALPALSADLHPTSAQLLWIVDIYGFMVAGSLITMGTLGDRIGRRKLLMIGAVAFGLASVVAAFSDTPGMLITTRALLGIAGATLAPSTLSLIRNMFHDPVQRTFAIGVWATSYSVGGAIGPLLGGIMLQYFWWGSVFLIAVPVMILLLALGPSLLPEFRDPHAERLDLLSAVMSLAAVLSVIYSMKQITQEGFGWSPIAILLAGMLFGILFMRRQKGLADPFIDLRLFRNTAFNASLATYTLAILVMFGTYFFMAQYLQVVLGLSPLEAGFWTMPSSFGFIAGSMLTPLLVRKYRPGYVIGIGMAIGATGFGLFTQIDAGGLPLLVAGSFIFSLGASPAIILSTDLIVSAAPPERSGSAASLSETSAELGGALGIAILGSIGTAVYRSTMRGADLEGVPANVKEEAIETVGGAVAVAGQLPEPLMTGLVRIAQGAFEQAFELNAVICLVITIGISIGSLIFLRKIPGSPH